MEDFKGFMLALGLIVFGVILVVFVVNVILGIARLFRRNEKPSDFVGGIAHSLVKDSDAWDYDSLENWILSEKYALEISLQGGNYGCINTRQPINSGSKNIVKFLEGPDRRAFVRAFGEWKDKTAIERQHRVERWKREATAAMAVAA